MFLNGFGSFSPDTQPQLYYAPGRTFLQALFSWQPNPFLGQAQFGAGIAPDAAFLFMLRSLGLAAWVAIRVWRFLLLVVAGWGAARLYARLTGDRTGPIGRFAAAVLYVANPYVIVSGATTPVLQPYALLPWFLLAFDQAVREPRSWRWPAGVALAFFLMGGLNAGIVPLFLLLSVPCYLVYARVALRRPGRQLFAATWRSAVLLVLVSLYWMVPAFLARGTGTTIALATERPQDVSSTSSYAESLRLLGMWPLYGRAGDRVFVPNAVGYVTNPFVVFATFLLPVGAAVGALVSRSRVRLLAAALLVAGLPVMVGLFPPQSPSPFGRLLEDVFLYVPGGIGFRTTNKVGALVALAVSLLIALGAAAIAPRRRRADRLARGAIVAVTLGILLLDVYPAWTGQLYASGWRRIPAYWQQAARDLNRGSATTRVLLLPGEESATYRWGKRGPEDLTASLLSRPSVLRTTVPTGSAYAANLLAALDQPLSDGTYVKGTLPALARYLGVRDVLVRNDMTWEAWGGARPSALAAELREGDLRLVATYGRPGENTVSPGPSAPPGSPRGLDARLAPLRRYVVTGPRPIVRAESARGVLVVDGDNFGVAELPAMRLLGGSPAFELAASLSPDELAQALRQGAHLVITDTNRRRAWAFRKTGVNYSATLGATQSYDAARGDLTFGLFGNDPRFQTVTLLRGAASISASGYGSVFGPVPADQPYFAFDGDPRTAWLAGGLGAAVGQGVTLRLSRPTTLSSLTFSPVLGPGRQVSRVRVNFGLTSLFFDVPPRPDVTVRFPPVRATQVGVQVVAVRRAGSNAVGFRDIAIPGVRVGQIARMPLALSELARRLPSPARRLLANAPLDVVMVRQAGDPANLFDDEEPNLYRQFTLPVGRSFTFAGVGSVTRDLPDPTIDELVGARGEVRADSSSRLGGGIGVRASSAIDGTTRTAWVPDGNPVGQWIRVAAPRQVVSEITIRQGRPGQPAIPRFISRADLSIDGGPAMRVSLDAGTTVVRLPAPTSVSSVRLTIRQVDGVTGFAGVSELQVGRLRLPETGSTTPLRGCVDAFQVDGRGVSISLPATLGRLAGRAPFAFTPCGDQRIALPRGVHRLGALPGWRIDSLDLSTLGVAPARASATGSTLPAPLPPRVDVLQSSATTFKLRARRASGPYFLVLGQGYDPRWRATMDGTPLGKPTLIDGYSVGWFVRDPAAHTFDVTYLPQRALSTSLALSLGGLALVVVLLTRRRPVPAPPDGERRVGR